MLTVWQAYLAIFFLLEKYYCEKDENTHGAFALGDLLGGMSPFTFSDGLPADPATYDDWTNLVKEVAGKERLSEDEAFNLITSFLRFHIENFGYDLQYVIDDLPEFKAKYWTACLEKAKLQHEEGHNEN